MRFQASAGDPHVVQAPSAVSDFRSKTFIKSVDLSDGGIAYQIEKAKALCMNEAFSSEPDLATPKLIDTHDTRGELTFEHMPPFLPFSPSTADIWFARTGRALALVHSRLTLPPELTLHRKHDHECKGLVFVHGDYTPKNIVIAEDQLIVFDWGLRPWSTETYTRTTPSLDLASFVAPWVHPVWTQPLAPVRKLRIMIDEYLLAIGRDSDPAKLARRTLDEELAVQFQHRTKGLSKLPLWKKPTHISRSRINRLMIDRATASYGRR